MIKRETSQPPNQDWNQAQGNQVDETDDDSKEPLDHGCLKASIWNKPDDDPRFVIRIGTAKIRSHSEDTRSKTLEDEERERKQFALYWKEVDRRFKKSKIKNYAFPRKQNQVKKEFLKSRNQKVTEKYIKLTDLFDMLKTQRSMNNLSTVLSTAERYTLEEKVRDS